MRLSVVVTVVDGAPALARCLEALAAQRAAPDLEILVPYDESVSGIAPLLETFPAVRFLPLSSLDTVRPKANAAGRHELYERRRASGLMAASGELLALLEDRGVPDPDWASQLAALHRLPHAAVGGSVRNARDQLLHWAVYFCDYARYQRPFAGGEAAHLTDVNVCYKRSALERVGELWRSRYNEAAVHEALLRTGQTLYLAPGPQVAQIRGQLGLRELLRERFAGGRLFGATRIRSATPLRRILLSLGTALLPLLLFVRLLRLQLAKRVTLRHFLQASPSVLLLLWVWSLGEAVGYATGRASCGGRLARVGRAVT